MTSIGASGFAGGNVTLQSGSNSGLFGPSSIVTGESSIVNIGNSVSGNINSGAVTVFTSGSIVMKNATGFIALDGNLSAQSIDINAANNQVKLSSPVIIGTNNLNQHIVTGKQIVRAHV